MKTFLKQVWKDTHKSLEIIWIVTCSSAFIYEMLQRVSNGMELTFVILAMIGCIRIGFSIIYKIVKLDEILNLVDKLAIRADEILEKEKRK